MHITLHLTLSKVKNFLIALLLRELLIYILMKSGVIYGLKCKVTDKWYVGQSWNVKKRWWTYSKYECRNQPKLYNALVKYGIDAFEKSILEENITDQDTLDAREDYWTEKYDCVNNGYNRLIMVTDEFSLINVPFVNLTPRCILLSTKLGRVQRWCQGGGSAMHWVEIDWRTDVEVVSRILIDRFRLLHQHIDSVQR